MLHLLWATLVEENGRGGGKRWVKEKKFCGPFTAPEGFIHTSCAKSKISCRFCLKPIGHSEIVHLLEEVQSKFLRNVFPILQCLSDMISCHTAGVTKLEIHIWACFLFEIIFPSWT